MKKYLFILSVVLLLTVISFSLIKAQTTGNASKTGDLTCVKAAVEKRETAIQTAFDSFSAAIKSALGTRKSELSAAWTITDKNQRQTAIKAAWDKFKESKQSTSKSFKTARDVAWKQFTTDRKACKALPTGENPGVDLSL